MAQVSIRNEPYPHGSLVRILACPLRNQHVGETGTVLESNGKVLCVDLGNGIHCWTSQVEAVQIGAVPQ